VVARDEGARGDVGAASHAPALLLGLAPEHLDGERGAAARHPVCAPRVAGARGVALVHLRVRERGGEEEGRAHGFRKRMKRRRAVEEG